MSSVDTLKQNKSEQCGNFKIKGVSSVDTLKQNRDDQCGHFKTKQELVVWTFENKTGMSSVDTLKLTRIETWCLCERASLIQ